MYKIEELKEYRGYYIDTNGIVYSSYIKGARGKRGTDVFPLKFSQDKDGYRRVVLSVNGNKFYKKICRLMGEQFIDNFDEHLVVNHIDGNKQNDNIKNLEMVTIKENTIHAWKNGLCSLSKNAIPISIENQDKTENFLSSTSFLKKYPCFSTEYLRELKQGTCEYKRICIRKENNKINCYFNGQIIKTFSNNIEASKYFNKAPNTISYKLHNEKDEKYKKYTITFPNQSTIESIN